MGKDFQNKIGLFVIALFSVAPFVGFILTKTGLRNFQVAVAFFGLAFLYFLFLKRGYLRMPAYVLFWGLFAVFTVLSDTYIAKTSGSIFKVLFYNKYIVCFYILLAIENLDIPDDFYSKITLVTKIVLVIAFFVIVIQQFVSSSFFVSPSSLMFEDPSDIEEMRLPSIYSWVGSSAYMGLAYFPLLAIIICEALRKDNTSKYIWVLFFMGAIVAFLNRSRFMMLNYIVIFAIIPFYKSLKLSNLLKTVFLIVGVAIGTYYGAKAINYDIDKVINERILETDSRSIEQTSAGTRLLAFKVFGELFPKNPWLGKGMLHRFGKKASMDIDLVRAIHGRSSQIHVGFLSLFYYYGIVGGGLFMLFLLLLMKKLYKDAKATKYWAVFFVWIMFVLTNLTLVTLDILNMGLILSLFVNKYYLNKFYQKELQ